MPIVQARLPRTQPMFDAEVRFLDTHSPYAVPGTPLRYLQRARISEAAAAADRDWYQRELSKQQRRFWDLLEGLSPDALVVAPSSRDDVTPFVDVAVSRFRDARVVARFEKDADFRCGVDAPTLDDALPHYRIETLEPPSTLRQLLIVDDIIANGMTAAVMIELMRRENFEIEQVVVAAPLNTARPPASSSDSAETR